MLSNNPIAVVTADIVESIGVEQQHRLRPDKLLLNAYKGFLAMLSGEKGTSNADSNAIALPTPKGKPSIRRGDQIQFAISSPNAALHSLTLAVIFRLILRSETTGPSVDCRLSLGLSTSHAPKLTPPAYILSGHGLDFLERVKNTQTDRRTEIRFEILDPSERTWTAFGDLCAAAIDQAINDLTPKQASAIALHLAGYSQEAIAQIEKTSQQTISKRLIASHFRNFQRILDAWAAWVTNTPRFNRA